MLCSNHKAFNHCTQFNFLELAKMMWKFFGWVFFKSTPILHTNFSYKNHHYCISFTLILPFTYKTYFLTCPCTVSALRKLCTLHRLPGGEQVDSVCLCSLVCCSWKTLINQKKDQYRSFFFSKSSSSEHHDFYKANKVVHHVIPSDTKCKIDFIWTFFKKTNHDETCDIFNLLQ